MLESRRSKKESDKRKDWMMDYNKVRHTSDYYHCDYDSDFEDEDFKSDYVLETKRYLKRKLTQFDD